MNAAKIAPTWTIPSVAHVLLLGVAMACCPQLAFGTEIYRWQDEQGNPVISDRRPAPGIPYTTLNPTRLGTSLGKRSSLNDAPSVALPRSETTEKIASTPTKRVDKPDTSQALCSRITDSISKLESLPRISVREPNGSTRFLSDTERKAKLSEAIKRRDQQCR